MSSLELENLVVELADHIRSRCFGKYRGLVKDVEDPENLGRVKATVPEVYGTEDSPWAMPSVTFAGANYGLLMLPKVNDGVWIEFEAGDISRPIWTGFWWASNEIPEPAGTNTRVIVTPGGHKIVLDDDQNEMHLLHSKGPEIKLSEDEILLKAGSSQIVLSSSEVNVNNGALVVKS